ncbi:hypothetical protein ACTA71_009946 [Dictyostelium dimigraforme]
MKLLIVLLSLLFIFSVLVQCSEEAYFGFKTIHDDEFVFKLTDTEKIEKARKILSGDETKEVHVMGRIIKSKKDYNPHYDYHLDPTSVLFFQTAIEVCDATTNYVNDHIDEACGAFLPGCYFCPWSSKLTREIKP